MIRISSYLDKIYPFLFLDNSIRFYIKCKDDFPLMAIYILIVFDRCIAGLFVVAIGSTNRSQCRIGTVGFRDLIDEKP